MISNKFVVFLRNIYVMRSMMITSYVRDNLTNLLVPPSHIIYFFFSSLLLCHQGNTYDTGFHIEKKMCRQLIMKW